MPTYTSKSQLRKPGDGESQDVADLNFDFDRIDAFGMGGTFICTSTTRPTGADRWDGMLVKETDTRRIVAYDAFWNEWVYVAGPKTVINANTGWSAALVAPNASFIVLGPSNITVKNRGPVMFAFESQVGGSSAAINWAGNVYLEFEDVVGSGVYVNKKTRRLANNATAVFPTCDFSVYLEDVSPGLHNWRVGLANDVGSGTSIGTGGTGTFSISYS